MENEDQQEKDTRTLNQVFLEGWNIYDELEETSLPFQSSEFQNKVKVSMKNFELATKIVSQIGMFSPNEMLEEVTTDYLQYLLLPYFLGKLALKLQGNDREEVLNVAETYFNDYIKRCEEYELCNSSKENNSSHGEIPFNENDSVAHLVLAAHARNDKIAQFRRKKELDEQIKKFKAAVKSSTVDDEIKREFFINFLKMGIIDAKDELKALLMEKQMVQMRKMHANRQDDMSPSMTRVQFPGAQVHSHQDHHHGHDHRHTHLNPKPKGLQPFIITRDTAQKAVFGRGYPSLPVMTVDDFYQQRVEEGIFPDADKQAKINLEKAIAAAQDPEEKEEEEKAAVEQQIDEDDPEYLARMRARDEYKDVVRRGDGNRHNRS